MNRPSCVHTYRLPSFQQPTGVRLFLGSSGTGYAVDTQASRLGAHGARVLRLGTHNTALLRIDASAQQAPALMEMSPQALRELAGRLLDAANDIEEHPAAALQRQAERSKEVTT